MIVTPIRDLLSKSEEGFLQTGLMVLLAMSQLACVIYLTWASQIFGQHGEMIQLSQDQVFLWPEENSWDQPIYSLPPRLDYGAYRRQQDSLAFCTPAEMITFLQEQFQCERP